MILPRADGVLDAVTGGQASVGLRVPAQHWGSGVFRQLFIQGTPAEIAQEVRRLRDGRSILDDLRARGVPTRVYLPYGPDWFRYWLRRVAESRGA